jgi:HSP20 family protein
MALPVRRSDSSGYQPAQRWEPANELQELHEQMERFMESVWSPAGIGNGGLWTPYADVEETEDAWVVEVELPGVDRKDVAVELRDSELSITGEIKQKERAGILRRRTRRTGRFEYRILLPGQADAEQIEANLRDGVLTVRVPKAEHARPRRIEVKSAKESAKA